MALPHPHTSDELGSNPITYGDYQYAVWHTTDGELLVGRRHRPTQLWGVNHQQHLITGAARTALTLPVADDEHNYPAIARTGDGYLHVWANMHNNPMKYIVSTAPDDITSWTPGTITAPPGISWYTYPCPFTLPNGTIILQFRATALGQYGSGQGNTYWWIRPPGASTWGTPTLVWNGFPPGASPPKLDSARGGGGLDDHTNFNAYPHMPHITDDGIMHFFWLWRAIGPNGSQTNSLPSYATYNSNNGQWRAADGTLLTAPISPADNLACQTGLTAETAAGYLNGGGRITVDDDGRPHIIAGRNPHYHIWWDGSQWNQQQVLTGSVGGGSLNGYSILSRMSAYWMKGALWVGGTGGVMGTTPRHPRLWRVDGGKSVAMGGTTAEGPGWDFSIDHEAWRRFGSLEHLAPDGDTPRLFSFGAGPKQGKGIPVQSTTFRGVNLAGAEFGITPGGARPTGGGLHQTRQATWDFLAARGHRLVRYPITWERIQPNLNGALDTGQVASVNAALDAAASAGISVILDVHNYGSYRPSGGGNFAVGSAQVPTTAFADLWTRLVGAFQNKPALFGWDLMNEPVNIPEASWPAISQAAVTAVRAAETSPKVVVVSGANWSSAHTWTLANGSGGPWITDPANKTWYQAHFYPHQQHTGLFEQSYDAELALAVSEGYVPLGNNVDMLHAKMRAWIATFTNWCATHNVKGFIGEYGWPRAGSVRNTSQAEADKWNALADVIYSDLDAAGMHATYWSSGEDWGNYELKAYDNPGGGALSAPTSVTPVLEQHRTSNVPAPTPMPWEAPAPAAPTLTAGTPTTGTVPLSWTASMDATGYEIQYAGQANGTVTVGNVTSHTLTGMAAGNYFVTVRAVNATNGTVSSNSNLVGVVVPSSSTLTIPSSIDATGTSDVAAALTTYFASVPNGETVTAPANAVYKVDDGRVLIQNKTNVTINWNGAELRRTRLLDWTLRWPYNTPYIRVQNCSGVDVKGFNIRGVNTDDEAVYGAHKAWFTHGGTPGANQALYTPPANYPYAELVYFPDDNLAWGAHVPGGDGTAGKPVRFRGGFQGAAWHLLSHSRESHFEWARWSAGSPSEHPTEPDSPGTYSVATAFEHGIEVVDCTDTIVENADIRGVGADYLYVSKGNNIVGRNVYGRRNGRQGIAFNQGGPYTFYNNDIWTRRGGIDFEGDNASHFITDIEVYDNTIRAGILAFPNQGSGKGANYNIHDNTIVETGTPVFWCSSNPLSGSLRGYYRRDNVTFVRNTVQSPMGGLYPSVMLSNVHTALVADNVLPRKSGSSNLGPHAGAVHWPCRDVVAYGNTGANATGQFEDRAGNGADKNLWDAAAANPPTDYDGNLWSAPSTWSSAPPAPAPQINAWQNPPPVTAAQALARPTVITQTGILGDVPTEGTYTSGSPAANTTYDFRNFEARGFFHYDSFHHGTANASSQHIPECGTTNGGTNRCVRIGNSTAATAPVVVGGVFIGNQSPSYTWEELKHGLQVQDDVNVLGDSAYSQGIPSQDGPGIGMWVATGSWGAIYGARLYNVMDGIRLRGAGAGTTLYIAHTYIAGSRDTSIETEQGGVVRMYDTLVDGGYGLNDVKGAPVESGRAHILEHCLIRLTPQPGGYKKARGTQWHDSFWKRDATNTPLQMANCTLAAEKPDGNNSLTLPTGGSNSYTNVTICWLGSGSWPGGAVPSGVTVIGVGGTDPTRGTLAAAQSHWNTMRHDWLARHGMPTGTPVWQAPWSELLADPNPSPLPPPPGSTTVTLGTVTDTTAALSWTAVPNATGYEVALYDVTNWIPVGNVLTYTFTGLSPSTSHAALVRATNADGQQAGPAAGASFTTSTPSELNLAGFELVRNVDFSSGIPSDVFAIEHNSTYGGTPEIVSPVDGVQRPRRAGRWMSGNVTVSAATAGGNGQTVKLVTKRETTGTGSGQRIFTGGMLSSKDAAGGGFFAPRFGRIEIRARIPHGHGLWPAFWTRHHTGGAGNWEIDIMEYFHSQVPGRSVGVLHRRKVAGGATITNVNDAGKPQEGVFTSSTGSRAFPFELPVAEGQQGWHTWAVETRPVPGQPTHCHYIWEVDGNRYMEFVDTQAGYVLGLAGKNSTDLVHDICLQGVQVDGPDVGHPDGAPPDLTTPGWIGSLGAAHHTGGCLAGGSAPGSCTLTVSGRTIRRAEVSVQSGGTPVTTEIDHVRVWRYVGGATPPPPSDEQTFENGTAGEIIPGTLAPFTTRTGTGNATYVADAYAGTLSMSAGPADVGYVIPLSTTAGSRKRVRFYAKRKSGTVSAHHWIAAVFQGSTYRGDTALRTTGEIQHRQNFTSGGSTATWPVDAWWRFEVDFTQGTGWTLRVWTNPSSTGAASHTITAPFTALADQLRFGNVNVNSGIAVRFDNFRVTDDGSDPGL